STGAVKEPRISRHDRVGHHGTRVPEMSDLPVARPPAGLASEVRSDPARAPKLRIVEIRFPGLRGLAEPPDVIVGEPNELGMAVGAALAPVDRTPTCYGCRHSPQLARP